MTRAPLLVRLAARLDGAVRRVVSGIGASAPAEQQGRPGGRFATSRKVDPSDVGTDLTVDGLHAAIRAADGGDPRLMWALQDRALDRDLHMLAVLSTRSRAVANLTWHVEPEGTSTQEREIATAARTAIARISNLEGGLIDLLDAIYKGVAFSEIEWSLRGGLVVPRRLHHRPQRWFRPDLDTPEAWRVLDESSPIEGIPLQERGWIVHTARARSAFPIQAGLGRTLLWWWLFRTYGIRDWVTYVEKYGAPLRLGKYAPGTDPKDVRALEEMVAQLGVDAYAVIPNDMDVQLPGDAGSKTGADTFERLLTFSAGEISKGVLGSTLTVETGGTGSYALGAVHNDVRTDIRDADARELARTLTDYLVRPFVEVNWGPDAPVPTFGFDIEQDDQVAKATRQKARGEVFTAARALGVPVTVRQVREELEIEEAQAGEELLPTPTAPVGMRLQTLSRAAFSGAQVRFAAVGEQSVVLGPFEAILSAAQAAVRSAWAAVVAQLRAQLGDRVEAATLRAALADALRQVDLGPYVDELVDATLRSEGLGLAQGRAERSDQVAELPKTSPTTDVAGWSAATGVTPADWSARITRTQAACADTARNAVLRAADDVLRRAEAAAAASEDVAGAVSGALDGAEADPKRTDAAVDGSATSAWGAGRWEGLTSNRAGKRLYLRYHTKQDKRVRPTHRAMEGRVYPIDHPIWRVWRPPNGFGCRCWVTVHTAEEVAAAGWTISEDYPEVTDKQGTRPAIPDAGWSGGGQPTYDTTDLPEEWRAAIDAAEAKRAEKRAAKENA